MLGNPYLFFQLKPLSFFSILCVFMLSASPVMSHHGRSNFLYDETVTLEGRVIEYKWKNPHSYIEMEVANENNEIETWLIEAGTIVSMEKYGWAKDSIKAGDPVIAVGFPDRNTRKNHMLLERIVLEDGKSLYLSTIPPAVLRARGLSRNRVNNSSADQPAVTPSRDFSGTWGRGPDNGVKTQYSLFKPPDHWPLTPLGEAQLARFNELDNPWYDCIERGLPFYSLYPYYLLWIRHSDRIVITSQQSTLVRTLYLNQDTHPEGLEPSPAGHSIARFADDGSLLVDTVGFPAFAKWGLAAGVDASGQKRVRERYTLSEDGLSMAVSITLEDPAYLAEPVTINGSDRKVADIPFEPYECDVAASRRLLSPPLSKP